MNIAIIFAGGSGKRMHSKARPKQFLELNGKPIIIHTLEVFDQHDDVDAIVVACIAGWTDHLARAVRRFELTKVVGIVPGGDTGQDSIYAGLCAAAAWVRGQGTAGDEHTVLIHDGVRPFITADTITDNIQTVRQHGGCITCVPATETFVVERAGGLDIPERAASFIARAPQSFRLRDILAAHEQARADGRHDFIDSLTLMHHYGHTPARVEGPAENIKITTPADFYVARAILAARENEQIFGL